jgi:excinuclease ABC subunit B
VTDILAHLQPEGDGSAPTPDRRRRSRSRSRSDLAELPQDELTRLIQTLEQEMQEAAAELRFEYAARLRDEIGELKAELRAVG